MSLQIWNVERNDHAIGDNLEFTGPCEREGRMQVLVLERRRGIEVNLIIGREVRDELVDPPLKFYGLFECRIINIEVQLIVMGAPL